MPRGQFDALRLELADGERVHVYGRPELYEQRGDFRLRALTIERFGLGAHLAALERLKQKLAAEGLFAAERKRPLPRIPRLIGLVTGNDAAAKRDVLTAITTRFPPAHVLVAETYVQGPRAAARDRRRAIARPVRARRRRDRARARRRQLRGPAPVLATSASCARSRPARCRSSRRSATSRTRRSVDLAADVRASTPSVAGRLVVPDLAELRALARRARTPASSAARARDLRAPRRAAGRRAASGCAGRRALALERRARAPRRDRRPPARAFAAGDARARLRDRPGGRGARARAAAAPGPALAVEVAGGALRSAGSE